MSSTDRQRTPTPALSHRSRRRRRTLFGLITGLVVVLGGSSILVGDARAEPASLFGSPAWRTHTFEAFSVALPAGWEAVTRDGPASRPLKAYLRTHRVTRDYVNGRFENVTNYWEFGGTELLAFNLRSWGRRVAERDGSIPPRLAVTRSIGRAHVSDDWPLTISFVKARPNLVGKIRQTYVSMAGGQALRLRWRQRFEKPSGGWYTRAFTQYHVVTTEDQLWLTFETTPGRSSAQQRLFRRIASSLRLLPEGRKAKATRRIMRELWREEANGTCRTARAGGGPFPTPTTIARAKDFLSSLQAVYVGYLIGLANQEPDEELGLLPDFTFAYGEISDAHVLAHEALDAAEDGLDAIAMELVRRLEVAVQEVNGLLRRLGLDDCALEYGDSVGPTSGGKPLTKAAYELRVLQIRESLGRRASDLYFPLVALGVLTPDECAVSPRRFHGYLVRIVDEVDRLEPPSKVADLHDRFLWAARESVAIVDEAVLEVERRELSFGQPLNARIYDLPSTQRAERVLEEFDARGYTVDFGLA